MYDSHISHKTWWKYDTCYSVVTYIIVIGYIIIWYRKDYRKFGNK